MEFIPNYGLVLIQLIDEEKQSEAGLILDMAKSLDADLPLVGRVIAAGIPNDYEEGDLVLARRYTGIKVEVDGEEGYLFNSNTHILGRFESDEV